MKQRDAGEFQRVFNWTPVAAGLTLLVFLSIGSLGVGAVSIPTSEVVRWMLGQAANESAESAYSILRDLRLPRVLGAIWIGGALACAGVGFQSLFRNPLADPYIIGASSGAALGVAIAIVLGSRWVFAGFSPLSAFAMFGSLMSVAVVFVIGQVGRTTSSLTLLLAGVAISSMTNALVSLLLYLSKRDAMAMTITWLMGSLADCDWNSLSTALAMCTVGILWIWSMSRQLDAYSLGDVAAQSLGLQIARVRLGVIAGASLATAAAVAVAGVVGFVGLIAPLIARILVGSRHAILIPMSTIVGALIMVAADAVARTVVAPVELPIGIVTALLGAPFFLMLLLNRSALRRL